MVSYKTANKPGFSTLAFLRLKMQKKKNVNCQSLENTADNVFQLNEGKGNFPQSKNIIIKRVTK